MNIFMKPYIKTISSTSRDYDTEFTNLFLENSIFEDHSFMLSMFESSNDINILEEGFSDMLESARSFFEKLIKLIKDFVKRQVTLIKYYINNFDKFIEKNREYLHTLNPDFNKEIYSFTIDEKSPDTSYIKNLVYSYKDSLARVSYITSDDIKEKKREFDARKNQLRGDILGTKEVITADEFNSLVKAYYRDGASKPYKTRITKGHLTFAIETFPKFKDMKSAIEKDQDDIVGMLNELKKFFSKGPTTYYRDNRRYIILNDIDVDNTNIKYNRSQDIPYDIEEMKKMDKLFEFQFEESKFISNIVTTVYKEKITAIKDAMKQCQEIITESLKFKNESSNEEK